MADKYAAIDIGSNAARLLIGELCQEDGVAFVKKISYTRLPLRLGEEVFDIGKISERKTEDFVKTMKAFSYIADIFDVKKLRACATSAMRDAENNNAIIQRIKEESGIEIEIISGDEEARLIFGTFSLLNIDKNQAYCVIDVGGGSTEISVFENGKRVAAKSFNIGTVRYLKGKVSPKSWQELESWINQNFDNSEHWVYGTGGNINKVHKLLGVAENQALSFSKMKKLHKEIGALSLEKRMEVYHLKPDRADVIVPALEIYTFCMEHLKAKEIYVPKIGLSDGMILDLATKK